MKRFSIALVLLACFAAAPLFAWEPEDLTKFPQEAKALILLNIGVGFDLYNMIFFGSEDVFSIPLIRATLDHNVPLGNKGLPFFIGGIFGFAGTGYKDPDLFFSRISIGGRFGYHFNWDVDRLDTYAVTTLGWIVYTGDGTDVPIVDEGNHSSTTKSINDLLYLENGLLLAGISFGARYFVTDWFGFWAELSFSTLSFADIGIAFKF